MQQPTCREIRIRSTKDAHKIFYAIQKGVLKMVTRRLDAAERQALTAGHIYAWEERGPQSEVTGLGIERFTEGRRWSPSRVRDEFLFYYERFTPCTASTDKSRSVDKLPPRNWDPLVKQTYSVWVETQRGSKKWHLTAYFTQSTVDGLGTVDDIPEVKDLLVPPGSFRSTRITRRRLKSEGGITRSSSKSSSGSHTYAPFSLCNPYPPASHSAPTYEAYPTYNSRPYPTTTVQTIHQIAYLSHHRGKVPSPTLKVGCASSPSKESLHSESPASVNDALVTEKLPFSEHSDFTDDLISPFHTPVLSSFPRANQAINSPAVQLPSLPGLRPYLEVGEKDLEQRESFIDDDSYEPCPRNCHLVSGFMDKRLPSCSPATSSPINLHSDTPFLHAEPSANSSFHRGLVSIQVLKRRQPYRRDPTDDKTLRLLPLSPV